MQGNQGVMMAEAIDLAIDKRGGRVGGWTIEHIRLDASAGEGGDWSVDNEAENATEAASDPSVVAYIGPYTSGASAVSLPITNKAGLLQLGPSATWPGLTRGGWNNGEPAKYFPSRQHTFVRLMPDDSQQGRAAANWASSMGLRRVFIFSDQSSYSDGLATLFYSSATTVGLPVVGRSAINPQDMAGMLARIEGEHAVAIFYAPSSPRAAAQVARSLGTGPQVFASDTALSDQFLEGAGQSAKNWHVVSNGLARLPANTTWMQFARDFEGRYGRSPTQFAGNSFDLTNLVLDAVSSGTGRDRTKVQDWVMQEHSYKGVTGAITFDEAGDVRAGSMSGYKVLDGKFVLDRVLELAP